MTDETTPDKPATEPATGTVQGRDEPLESGTSKDTPPFDAVNAQGESKVSGQDAAEDVAASAKAEAGKVRDEMQNKAGETVNVLKDQARTSFDKGRHEVADQVERFSRALRGSGEQLREQDIGTVATYPEQVADRVDEVGRYLRERDLEGMRRDFERSLDRDPVLVLGGLAALSAATVWYVKKRNASQTRAQTQSQTRPRVPEKKGSKV